MAGTPDDLWTDKDYENMRSMKDATVEFVVNCEGQGRITKRFSISINHDATPYVAVDMAPATAEVTFDEQWRNGSYSAKNSSFIGLPIDISLLARYNEERVKITAVVPTLDGDQLSLEDYTLSYYNADSSDGDSSDSDSSDDSSDEDPLTGSIDGSSIRALPKPATGGTLLNHRVLSLALTATYAGVSYERTMRVPLTERYKTVTSTNVRHYLLTANDDWGQAGVPPYDYSGWTTTPDTTEVSAEYPYLWIWDETVFSNGKTANATPILMGNWAESAVTYFIDVTPGMVPTEADGTIKQSAQNIVIVPYKRLGTEATQRIQETGFMLIVTSYDAAGQQVGNPAQAASTTTSAFSMTWTPVAGAVRAVVKFTDNSTALTELCTSVTIPYVSDGANGADGLPGTSPLFADLDNEMDAIRTTGTGTPTASQSVTTHPTVYSGNTAISFTISKVQRNGTDMTAGSGNTWTATGITVAFANGVITVTYATTATLTDKDEFTFIFSTGSAFVAKALTIIPTQNDIYQIVPSTQQISVERSGNTSFTPATVALSCGYTKVDINGNVTTAADVTGTIDGVFNLYHRLLRRSDGIWTRYRKYTTYKSTDFPLDVTTYSVVEFVICKTDDVDFIASQLSSKGVVDKETVPVVSDGYSAVNYYLTAEPNALALAPGGDTFTDGSTSKTVNVKVFRRIGHAAPITGTDIEGTFKVAVTTVTGSGPSTVMQKASSFQLTVTPTVKSISLTLQDYTDDTTIYDTKTITVQSAGLRGYQGASPRRREWATGLTWHTGAEGDTWKDFCAIKDAQGRVQQFECIKEHISTTSNCPLNADGTINTSVVYPGTGTITDSYLWREPTEQFDFVTTNVLLSKDVLAESGAFDGLRVNFLTVDRNSYIGGFMFNTPYPLLNTDIKKCVNPYNYGMTDWIMWGSDNSVFSRNMPVQEAAIYESLNVMFPDCGSSIVIRDASLTGYDTARGKPTHYVYVNLPFFFPYNAYEDGEHVVNYTPAQVAGYLKATGSAFLPYINEENPLTYNPNTKALFDQMEASMSLCYEYLGARITVRNEIAGTGEVIIYGVRDVEDYSDESDLDAAYHNKYKEIDPWGRTSFYWEMSSLKNQYDAYIDKLPYVSLKSAKNTIDAYRYMEDPNELYQPYEHMDPTKTYPVGTAQHDATISGHGTAIKLQSYLESLTPNRIGCWSHVYDTTYNTYDDPLYSDPVPLTVFWLKKGWFVTLEMTYEEGYYFWKIINHGPIPTTPTVGS